MKYLAFITCFSLMMVAYGQADRKTQIKPGDTVLVDNGGGMFKMIIVNKNNLESVKKQMMKNQKNNTGKSPKRSTK